MMRYKIAQKVGKKIRLARKKLELSQEEAAAKSGIHVSTYGRIERGEINTPLQTLNRISQALKTKIEI
jgi:transcriptional regulator with XRE-family HTH domain